MQPDDVTTILGAAQRGAEQVAPTLAPDGDWAPVLLAVCRSGPPQILQYPWSVTRDQGAKDRWQAHITRQLREWQAVAAALVMTAYAIDSTVEGVTMASVAAAVAGLRGPSGTLADHPARIEIVQVHAVGGTRAVNATATITRREHGHPLLGPWSHLDDTDPTVEIVGDFPDAMRRGLNPLLI
jgi:hypothetical protein